MNKSVDETIDDLAMTQKVYDKTGRKWDIDRKSMEYKRFVKGCKAGIALEKKRSQKLFKTLEWLKGPLLIATMDTDGRSRCIERIDTSLDKYNEGK